MALKRAMDVAVSGVFLAVAWPFLFLIGAAVRLESNGPALFRHERVGRNGEPFDVMKFRTMAASTGGPEITSANDQRITRLGAVLRKYKLDELPQLLNVLRGEMSLVGPRPEVLRYVEAFPAEYAKILSVRPGITDPASLRYRDEQEILAGKDDPEAFYLNELLPEKLRLSAEYVDQQSARRDVAVVWQTLRVIAR